VLENQPFASDRGAPHRITATVRLLEIVAGQFQHAHAAQAVAQPLGDLASPRIDQRHARAACRLLIDRLAQCTSDRRLAVAQFSRDRAQALAVLVQQMNGTVTEHSKAALAQK
jgi:hypothetical protein